MRSKWIPILILFLLLGVGLQTGLKLVLKDKKPNRLSEKKEVSEEKGASISEKEMKSETELKAEESILGVLREVNEKNQILVIYNVKEKKEEGYPYDLSTSVKNSYEKETVMEGLSLGSILELYFGADKKLKLVKESKEAWDYVGVQNLKISSEKLSLEIGERKFIFDAGLTVINGRELGSITDILPDKDVLRVRGIAEKVLSISVTKGHGTIDFLNYDEFIGGSIEIGYDVFDEIKGNMKYILREGTYKLIMQNGGLFVNKVIEIERNRIRLLDLSVFRGDMDKSSEVRFEIFPSDATLFLDGREVEARGRKVLPYGEYIVKVMKEGYKTFDDIIKVKKPKEKLKISLAKETEAESKNLEDTEDEEKSSHLEENEETSRDEEEEKSSEAVEEEADIPVKRDESGKIVFLKPLGATVLFDDKVVGVVPCETVKVTGEHKITLEKDGYSSLSYTVDIADDGEDAVFSFPELTE